MTEDLRFYEDWQWDPSFGAHAEKGPSASSIWLRCAGAINAQRGRPDDAGFEAAEGTVFHEWAEICLKFDLEPHHIVIGTEMEVEAGGKLYTIAYNEKMRDSMYEGLDLIRSYMALDPDAILYVEKKVNLEPWCGPKQFGTTDVAIVCPNLKLIIIFDWKYGGIPVYPVANEQASLYCLGTWVSNAGKHFNFDPHGVKVHIHIEQPRAPGGGGDWETTMTDLLAWGEDVKIKAALTDVPDAPRTAGEKQCRYCKARKPSAGKPACATYLAHKLDLFGMKFDDIDTGFENGTPPVLPEIDELTPERLSYIYLNRASLMKFLEDIHEVILDNHDRGLPTPLLKVVSGRGGARKPKASAAKAFEYTAKAWLGEKAYTKPVLLSAPKIEELVGKKAFRESFAKFVTAELPGRSLVVIQDSRDAHVPVADKFTDEDLI